MRTLPNESPGRQVQVATEVHVRVAGKPSGLSMVDDGSFCSAEYRARRVLWILHLAGNLRRSLLLCALMKEKRSPGDRHYVRVDVQALCVLRYGG